MQIQQLTDLELKVLKVLSNSDEYDELPTSSLEDLEFETEINVKQLRGILSSLIQKELVQKISLPSNKPAFSFLNNTYKF